MAGELRLGGEGRPTRSVVVAVAAPVAATALGLLLERQDASVTAVSMYLLGVVAAAAIGGLWSGLGASILSFLGLNFFFTPPRHTFRVGRMEDLVALVVFLLVAAVVGTLLARAIEERGRATRRERESRLLGYFATKLLSGEPLERVVRDLATALLEPLRLSRCEVHARAGKQHVDAVAEEPGTTDGPSVTIPVSAGTLSFGELTAVRRAGVEPIVGQDRQLLEAAGRQIAVALERVRLDEQVEGARVASETNQMRAALFSAVTHDLRTPLASIKTGVTSLLDEEVTHDPSQERELLLTVLEETDRLNRLLGNVLDLAKVRAGALAPLKEQTAVDEVIDAVLHRIGPRLSNVRVRTMFRPDVPEVPADPVQLDQVVTNVVENALRFSPPGGEIQISVAPWQRFVQIRISDQGPGIPTEDRERVFEAFYRRDATDARGGSGLGLAIARAIVLAHGGRIRIEGAPIGGTSVVVELPMADAEPVPQEPTA